MEHWNVPNHKVMLQDCIQLKAAHPTETDNDKA